MTHMIVELRAASRLRAAREPHALSRQVWDHAQRAKQRNLQPVVELYSPKSKLCNRLTELWESDTPLTSDTLSGIYLIRIDVVKQGPEAVIELTARALLGVPVFVGWNPHGQCLSRLQLAEFEDKDLALPLSAFFEDVIHERPFRLERRKAPRTRRPKSSAAGTPMIEQALTKPVGQSPVNPSTAESQLAEQATSQEAALSTSELQDAARTAQRAPNAHVLALEKQLDAYVKAARELAVRILTERALLSDLSLESLTEVDVLLSEDEALRSPSAEAQQLMAALAVYFGETLRAYGQASWFVDTTKPTLTEALRLHVTVRDEHYNVAPADLVLAASEDPAQGLLSQAAELCGLWSNEGPLA